MEFLQSPLNQLLIFVCLWIVVYIRRWRESGYVMVMGFYAFSSWLLFGAILGVSSDVPWMYYLNLVGVLIAGYTICLLSNIASDKWGEPYIGEGRLIIFLPVFMTPALLIPSAIIKYIIQSI